MSKKPAKISGRGVKQTKPSFVTVKVREMYQKPSGHWGCHTRWEKVDRETWNARWSK